MTGTATRGAPGGYPRRLTGGTGRGGVEKPFIYTLLDTEVNRQSLTTMRTRSKSGASVSGSRNSQVRRSR